MSDHHGGHADHAGRADQLAPAGHAGHPQQAGHGPEAGDAGRAGEHAGQHAGEHDAAELGHHDTGDQGHGVLARQVRGLEALLERKGLVDPKELDRALEAFLARSSPAGAARMVARAWVDDGFRQRLLADANATLPEVGLSMGGGLQEQRLKVLENTRTAHHVVVCTLCSCYPIALLGPSPTWYKSEAYRSRVVRDPRSVLAEFGTTLPDDVEITVWDASAESRYAVLPRRPEGTEHLDEAALAALVTRNGLIGVAVL